MGTGMIRSQFEACALRFLGDLSVRFARTSDRIPGKTYDRKVDRRGLITVMAFLETKLGTKHKGPHVHLSGLINQPCRTTPSTLSWKFGGAHRPKKKKLLFCWCRPGSTQGGIPSRTDNSFYLSTRSPIFSIKSLHQGIWQMDRIVFRVSMYMRKQMMIT